MDAKTYDTFWKKSNQGVKELVLTNRITSVQYVRRKLLNYLPFLLKQEQMKKQITRGT